MYFSFMDEFVTSINTKEGIVSLDCLVISK